MTYKILRAESTEELEKLVNEFIKQGYKPQGGVVNSTVDNYRFKFFHQAMVKL